MKDEGGLRALAVRFLAVLRDSGPLWATSLAADRLMPIGILGLWRDRRVAPDALGIQLAAIFSAWGMSEEHVAVTVAHVLYADLHGVDSHGSGMLLHYQHERLAGLLNAKPAIEIVQESATTALVDGGGGLGHVPADRAMKLAIEKCGASGIAAVAVRNSGHFGAAGAYTAMAASAGLLAWATTNTRLPAVVPTRARDAKLGTNPIAFAAPSARGRPFLLDMATSTASLGKLTMAWRKGHPIPAGWALDRRGHSQTAARRGLAERRLTPLGATPELGSHKGYGLAAMVEILSAVLPGGSPAAAGASVGHFFLVLDPARFRPEGEFEEGLDSLVDGLRSAPPLDAAAPVLVAGDPEAALAAERRERGIPLTRVVFEDLRQIARASGAPFVLDQ